MGGVKVHDASAGAEEMERRSRRQWGQQRKELAGTVVQVSLVCQSFFSPELERLYLQWFEATLRLDAPGKGQSRSWAGLIAVFVLYLAFTFDGLDVFGSAGLSGPLRESDSFATRFFFVTFPVLLSCAVALMCALRTHGRLWSMMAVTVLYLLSVTSGLIMYTRVPDEESREEAGSAFGMVNMLSLVVQMQCVETTAAEARVPLLLAMTSNLVIYVMLGQPRIWAVILGGAFVLVIAFLKRRDDERTRIRFLLADGAGFLKTGDLVSRLREAASRRASGGGGGAGGGAGSGGVAATSSLGTNTSASASACAKTRCAASADPHVARAQGECTCANGDVSLIRSIGKGTFGDVHSAVHRGEMVAVKTYNFGAAGADSQEVLGTFIQEVSIIRMLRHPNILCFFGASLCPEARIAHCITEVCVHGSFEDVMADSRYAWENMREKVLVGVCKAMCFLHNFLDDVIIHHDLKPANVLIGDNFQPKLSDFGVSLQCKRKRKQRAAAKECGLVSSSSSPVAACGSGPPEPGAGSGAGPGPGAGAGGESETDEEPCLGAEMLPAVAQNAMRGSPIYLAPEIHLGDAFDEKIDVYAFALVMCEALAGDGMFVVKSFDAQKTSLPDLHKMGFRPHMPVSVCVAKPLVVALMEECWAEDAAARPSFSDIARRLREASEAEAATNDSRHRLSNASLRLQASSSEAAPLTDPVPRDRSTVNLSVRTGSELLVQDGTNLAAADALGTGMSQSRKSSLTTGPLRSPTGRAYSTFSTNNNQANSNVLSQLCQELQQELRTQAEDCQLKLEEQKDKYEKKLAALANTIL